MEKYSLKDLHRRFKNDISLRIGLVLSFLVSGVLLLFDLQYLGNLHVSYSIASLLFIVSISIIFKELSKCKTKKGIN